MGSVATFLRRVARALGRREAEVLGPGFGHLRPKQREELRFWVNEIQRYVAWYEGRLPDLYEVPSPTEAQKVRGFDATENAARTWQRVTARYYLDALGFSEDALVGLKVLDIGCGPTPYLLAFRDCERYGLDQLIEEYKRIGFPLDSYTPAQRFLVGSAERIPAPDVSFDAVLSVNAIDHVDDFGAAAREVTRVLKPGGILRMQTHYHEPTICEPWRLNDEVVLHHFGHLGVKKVQEAPVPGQAHELLVVWSTPTSAQTSHP
jgi:SAM-dependent methyltransferase